MTAVASWPSETFHDGLTATGGLVGAVTGEWYHLGYTVVAAYLVDPPISLLDAAIEHERLATLTRRIAQAAAGRLEDVPLTRVARRRSVAMFPVFTADRGGISYLTADLSGGATPPRARRRRVRPLLARLWAALPVHRACICEHDEGDSWT